MNMTAARLQRLGEVCESNLDRFFRQILSISQPAAKDGGKEIHRHFDLEVDGRWDWM